MKSAKAGRVKFAIAIGLTVTAGIIIISCVGGIAPAIINWLLQPWTWAKTQMFSSILNTFHLNFMESIVNWSTANADKFIYFLIQIVQTFSLVATESKLVISPTNKELLDKSRNVGYAVEIPINAFYTWNYYTDGDGRESNILWRVCLVIFFTTVNTLIFEFAITFLFRIMKGIVGVFLDNKEYRAS